MKISPLFGYVLIEPDKREEQTKSGIIIPDPIKKKRPEFGTIKEIGPGAVTPEGQTIPMTVKVGQRVLFAKYDAEEFEMDGKTYLIVKEAIIYAIIE